MDDMTYTLTLKDGGKFALAAIGFQKWLKSIDEKIDCTPDGRLEQLQRYCKVNYLGTSTFKPHQIVDWELN